MQGKLLVAGSPIGGFAIQNSGVPAMLLIAMLSALLSGTFIFAGIKKRKMS